MSFISGPVMGAAEMSFSQSMRRTLSGLCDIGFARVSTGSGELVFGTLPDRAEAQGKALPFPSCNDEPGRLIRFAPIDLSARELDTLKLFVAQRRTGSQQGPAPTGRVWRGFCATFDTGRQDSLAILVPADGDSRETFGFLSTIWTVLREDCLLEAQANADGLSADQVGDDALMWMMSTRTGLALLVMNGKGQMLRANTAARTMLDQCHVLRKSPTGIQAISDQDTRAFRKALADTVAEPPGSETVLFLETRAAGLRLPVTMTRFVHHGRPTDLVTVVMPTPPDTRRVEMLAREMGLTQAEARVAALLQLGLSNRDAAQVAGLKEQSFSTYAKRVLGKLNVGSRAQMAQMLTWQAQGGSMQ